MARTKASWRLTRESLASVVLNDDGKFGVQEDFFLEKDTGRFLVSRMTVDEARRKAAALLRAANVAAKHNGQEQREFSVAMDCPED